MYQHFYKIYDRVTNQSKYPEWKKFTLEKTNALGIFPKSLLDVACGTCSNSILYAKEGIKVIGVDQSKGMLGIAAEKFAALGLKAQFYNQSFYKMDFAEKADLAICHDFSTNHILSSKLFVRFLKNVYDHLNPGGVFVFDIKPRGDWEKKFAKYSDFIKVDDKFGYRWQVDFDRLDKNLIHLKFVLRVSGEKGGVREYVENNDERVYGRDELCRIITKSGFKLENIYDNYADGEPTGESKLWVFVLKK